MEWQSPTPYQILESRHHQRLRWLMWQPAYAEHHDYPLSIASTAIRHQHASMQKCILWTGGGRHRYGEIAEDDDVLTDDQPTLSVGDTLVRSIFMSDGTFLMNLSRDKTVWPVYITIGNLSSKIREVHSTHSVMMVAHLPIAIQNRNIPPKWVDEQRQTCR